MAEPGTETADNPGLSTVGQSRLHNGWAITTTTGTADAFHRQDPSEHPDPAIWIHRPAGPALVLGSTQPDGLVDLAAAAAAELEVCRRRSGGGLVHIDPATDCWIDVVVPRASVWWHDDVGRAFHWVGRHWADVLAAPPLGLPTTMATTSATSPAGRVWCFADLGHGELSVAGSKVLGLSQRRTRNWLRIQGLVIGRWPARRLQTLVDLEVLTSTRPDRFPDRTALDPTLVRAGVPAHYPPIDPVVLAERFVERIPSA